MTMDMAHRAIEAASIWIGFGFFFALLLDMEGWFANVYAILWLLPPATMFLFGAIAFIIGG